MMMNNWLFLSLAFLGGYFIGALSVLAAAALTTYGLDHERKIRDADKNS